MYIACKIKIIQAIVLKEYFKSSIDFYSCQNLQSFDYQATQIRVVRCNASVVKLVDTPDSKSGSFTGVAVQVRPLVPSFLTRNLSYE
jgi:hypothetical protein